VKDNWARVFSQNNQFRTLYEVYIRLILSPFFSQLTDEKTYGHFMEDNAAAHTVDNSVVALDKVFSKRVMIEDCSLHDHLI
jgi:hypothetical protein